MRSRGLLIVGTILIAIIFVTGACSAGFIAGRFIAPPEVREVFVTPEIINPPVPDVDLPEIEQNEAPPENERNDDPEVLQPTPAPTRQSQNRPNPPRSTEELFAPFWKAWDLVHQLYVDQPVDDLALMQGAIEGMLEALGDEHSGYMYPDEYRQATMDLDQEYEGIGAFVETETEYLTIVSPMPDSPAEKAGLKPGDEIIAVDGEDMTGIDASLVLRRVIGPAGTEVTLTIRRSAGDEDPGAEPEIFDVTITRAKITLPGSVTGEMLEDNIAYINISSFAANTNEELLEVMEPLLEQNPRGLILDLRHNGGGFLHVSVSVASQFLEDGVVLYEEYGDGSREVFEVEEGGVATEIPLVVLIDEGSASASEIVAGALQDLERATLVGVTSFGKGKVQQWIALGEGDDGAVRITVARWLTPDGRQIDEVGLEPDVVVEMTEEDIEAERDPQLDKAIELLMGE